LVLITVIFHLLFLPITITTIKIALTKTKLFVAFGGGD